MGAIEPVAGMAAAAAAAAAAAEREHDARFERMERVSVV
jgi:hypothetical protein